MTWRLGDLETWRDRETWRLGDLETWRLGDWETWRLGDLETWRLGDQETWRRCVEGGAAVLHTVRAKSSVFQKTAYSCSVISMFVIQLQPNELFFMKFPRLTSRILATVDFQVWESSKVHFGSHFGSPRGVFGKPRFVGCQNVGKGNRKVAST